MVDTEDTVGAVVSVGTVVGTVVSVVDSSLSSLQEMMVRLKRDMRIMYKTLFKLFLYK